MLLKNSFESVIEALYLGEALTCDLGKSDVRVNPKFDRLELDYTFGKTIILTDDLTEEQVITKLLGGNNRIISRVKYKNPEVLFQPYIMRINFNVMWNGETYKCPPNLTNSREIFKWIGDIGSYDCEDNVELYFPKILGVPENITKDKDGNLNSLGWVLHQVGINLDKTSKFKDLDLLKTKKIRL
jgi:hypothetical protein